LVRQSGALAEIAQGAKGKMAQNVRLVGWVSAVVLMMAGWATAGAQEPGTRPETLAPAPQASAAAGQAAAAGQTAECPAAATSPSGHHNDPYWQKHDHDLLFDFGNMDHYKAANAELTAPAAGEQRVIFMGDSITEGWKIDGPKSVFPGKPYFNRGISGQTTPQMLVRFRQDVIDLKPKVVVMLAGTNDLAGNTGPMTLEQTEGNLASMAELAAQNGIRVVMCSVTPAFDFPWQPGLEPAPKIVALNKWIKDYATRKGYVFVDYYSALADARGGLPPNLSHDGVHPNPAGYAIMTPLVETGIAKALEAGSEGAR
jgi:acyl-CoA thioesterase I